MSWLSLTRVAPPATRPLDLAKARAHLRLGDIAAGDEAEADDVAQLLDAAIAMIDGPKGIGVAMIDQTWRYSLDRLAGEIALPLGPVSEILSITYVDSAGDEQTLAPSRYELNADQEPATLTPAHGETWPTVRCQPGSVKIHFVAGYGPSAADVPANLIAAVKLILRGLFEDPEGEMPKGAVRILDLYRVGLVA